MSAGWMAGGGSAAWACAECHTLMRACSRQDRLRSCHLTAHLKVIRTRVLHVDAGGAGIHVVRARRPRHLQQALKCLVC